MRFLLWNDNRSKKLKNLDLKCITKDNNRKLKLCINYLSRAQNIDLVMVGSNYHVNNTYLLP